MKVIIDRFEGGYAVAEPVSGKEYIDLPISALPSGVKEGDVIEIKLSSDNKIVSAEFDKNETENRQERIKNLINQVFQNRD